MTRSPQRPDLQDVASEAARAKVAMVETSAPGFILSYDRSTQSAKVQISVNYLERAPDGSITSKSWRPIVQVPVQMPSVAGGGLVIPIAKNDPVLVTFLSRDSTRWFSTAGTSDGGSPRPVDPVDPRRFSESDAVAIPGVYPFANVTRPDSSLADEGATVLHGEDIRLVRNDASDFAALASKVDALFNSYETLLGLVKLWANTHTHPVTTGVAQPTATPLTAGIPATPTVASDKVRIE